MACKVLQNANFIRDVHSEWIFKFLHYFGHETPTARANKFH